MTSADGVDGRPAHDARRVGRVVRAGRARGLPVLVRDERGARAGRGRQALAIATPPGTLERSPAVAAVISELGIAEVYRVGGAQAIAALAFGTESIPRVDKIVGPGNIYVAIAKKLVYGAVGHRFDRGADGSGRARRRTADARFVAADLLAQAEHDERGFGRSASRRARSLAREVADEVERQLALARATRNRGRFDRSLRRGLRRRVARGRLRAGEPSSRPSTWS